MSYINNDTIIIDSVLTKRGRELMSQGRLNITKFALADDEIDYSMYDPAHPSGSEYYASAIESMPVLEAVSNETQVMKSLIVTRTDLDPNTELFIDIGTSEFSVYLGGTISFSPNTVGKDIIENYTVLLKDSKYITLYLTENVSTILATTDDRINFGVGTVSKLGNDFTLVTKKLINVPSDFTTWETEMIITGNNSGKTKTIPITIRKR